MTTFRLDEVTVAEVEARLDRCDAGAEAGCETVDGTLLCYAKACHEVREATRAWGLAVFAGRVPPDAATERAWREAGGRVYGRAVAALLVTHRSDVPGAKADAQTHAALGALGTGPITLGLGDAATRRRPVGPAASESDRGTNRGGAATGRGPPAAPG